MVKILRVIFFVFSLITLFVFSSVKVSAQVPSFSLRQNPANPEKGEIFDLQVLVSSYLEVNTVHVELSYPYSLLTMQDISFTGSNFPGTVERTDEGGLIKITAYNSTPFRGRDGLVATVQFKVIDQGLVTISSSSASKIHSADGSGKNILTETTSLPSVSFVVGGTGGNENQQNITPGPQTTTVKKGSSLVTIFVVIFVLALISFFVFKYLLPMLKKRSNSDEQPPTILAGK